MDVIFYPYMSRAVDIEESRSKSYLVQYIHQIAQTLLDAISSFIPFPAIQDIIIHSPFVYEHMLRQLDGVIVE